MDLTAMMLNDRLVLPECLPDLKILPFSRALDAIDVRIPAYAEPDQQIVFQADEEP